MYQYREYTKAKVFTIWEFLKIGDPNIVYTLNSRILIIIRIPKQGTPKFRKLPFPGHQN